MLRERSHSLLKDQRGATAATFGLALFALVAVGGMGFDYARLAGMDSELQNAADQAALAGASQLDGKNGACLRASAAASTLVTNLSLLANDGGGTAVTITAEPDCDAVGNIRFWRNAEKTQAATDDSNANFIEVFIGFRTANYAFTPLVAALSGTTTAAAVAGVGSAICRVPPVMMCNPDEPVGNTNANYDFDANSRVGVGIRLVGDGSYAPGNFGYLNTDFGNGANALLAALGWDIPPGDCARITGVDTKTGLNASVIDGLNTRFDIDANGNTCTTVDGVTGTCSPSVNVRKDLVRGNSCGITGNGWEENDANSANYATRRYRPVSAAPISQTPEIMGLPRDMCHAWSATGNCTGGANGRIGDGQWDINAYWRSHYGANYAGEINAATYGAQPQGYPTRYQVYRWEIDDLTRIGTPKAGQGGKFAYSKPVAGKCLATPTDPYGVVPGGNNVDRRRISAAVLNCQALSINGHETNLPVVKWVDLFLVEPSIDRTRCKGGSGGCNTKYTDKTDVYVELIGETGSGTAGQTAGQVVQRNVPYLLE
ncbi:TadE/TadG family type IV pilus assembly protein [Sphingopyxis alaskensis]|jgi:Flp pilus assembly protein TadG|uniref:TadE/TadG family type IV pilus assembly protein n=1 Tax=Sphingopyxis alaskensis TaxID=117207 RepID=UPI00203DE67D|nr:pilus assembly protein TadG-related protein [Sphingopyxis alaskensis]MCM3417815.1 pilus assembly protein TadG-related protein [Sphingopyxis alaskensis]